MGAKYMHSRNSMKSVIAQGSSISKAIEEALKKAGMPAEFFVKLLQDAQGGFLGFGAQKAKIALFFKQKHPHEKESSILAQSNYEDLFNSQSIKQQIENQIKNIDLNQPTPKQKQEQPKQQNQPHREQRPQFKPRRPQPKPIAQETKPNQPENNNPRPQHKPMHQKPIHSQQPKSVSPQSQLKSTPSLTVRPLLPKKNDTSK